MEEISVETDGKFVRVCGTNLKLIVRLQGVPIIILPFSEATVESQKYLLGESVCYFVGKFSKFWTYFVGSRYELALLAWHIIQFLQCFM